MCTYCCAIAYVGLNIYAYDANYFYEKISAHLDNECQLQKIQIFLKMHGM